MTDFALSVECGIFAVLLARQKSTRLRWPVIFFISTAVATLTGGIFHGFFQARHPASDLFWWPLTMLAIGVCSVALARIAADLALPAGGVRIVAPICWLIFLIYCGAIPFLGSDFRLAIALYLPAVLFLAWAFIRQYRRTHAGAFAIGITGIFISLAGSAVQQAKISIDPRYFDYNALYHVLQGIGLFALYIALGPPRRRS